MARIYAERASVVTGLLAALFALLVLRRYDLLDDAYITGHYAQHLAFGQGWTWNAGSAPTDGTTAPLWTLILAGALAAHLPFVPTVTVLCSLSYGVMVAAATRLAARVGGSIALIASAVAFVALSVLLPACAGMETTLYGTVTLAAFLCWDSARPRLSLLLAGILPLIRGEGLLLLLVIYGAVWASGRARALWRPALMALLPFIAWEIFSLLVFHALLPNSFLAKHAQSAGIGGKITLVSFFSDFILMHWSPMSGLSLLIGAGLAVATCWRRRVVVIMGAWLALYIGFYSVAANVPQQGWYVLPAWWVAAALLAGGLGHAWRRMGSFIPHTLSAALCAACLFLALSPAPALLWPSGSGGARPVDENALAQQAAAVFLAHHAGGVVAAAEVGRLGYYSGHPVLDIEGLVSPEVISHVQRRDYGWIITQTHPRYVFIFAPPVGRPCVYELICGLWSRPWFRRHYATVASWPLHSPVTDAYVLLRYH